MDASKRRGQAAARPGDPERTEPLTGEDGELSAASTGDAGDGASPWGADMTGYEDAREAVEGREDANPLEEEPDRPADIVPDKVVRGAARQGT